jgi:hypothetical protein
VTSVRGQEARKPLLSSIPFGAHTRWSDIDEMQVGTVGQFCARAPRNRVVGSGADYDGGAGGQPSQLCGEIGGRGTGPSNAGKMGCLGDTNADAIAGDV